MSHFLIIFSLLLLNLETATAHLVGDDNGIIKKCLDHERDALLHFKAPLEDPLGYGCLSSWTADQHDCCKWTGVTCNNQTGYVTGLNISFCAIVGEIGHSLLNLSNLNNLHLTFNGFYGTIPAFIGSLTKLRYLDLSNNNLNETIPRSIGSLTELMYLDLSGNPLYGTIPRSMGSLTRLRNIDLSFTSLYGTIPPEFGNLTSLQSLILTSVGRCRVENLEWLSHLSHLQTLNMDGISLAKQNHWVDLILSFQKLSYLSLQGCELSHVKYPYSSFLNSSSSIEFLYLGSNNLTSPMYSWLFLLTNNRLLNLDLSSNTLDGTIPSEFGMLTNLQVLVLSDVGKSRVENLEWLSNLSHLELLGMDGISLAKQNHWVDVILSLRNLTDLSLKGCELSQVMYPYSSVLNSSSSLEILHLQNNSLTSSMYSWLFPLTSNRLIDLDISYNMLDGIPDYLGNLCSLERLEFHNNLVAVNLPDFLSNLSGCTSLSLQELIASGNRFTGSLSEEIQEFSSLTDLDLSGNHLNGSISEKLLELPSLTTLVVSFNNLRVPSTYHMSSLSNVEYIDMRSCKVGPRFPSWIQTLKNLTHLDLSNARISDTTPLDFWDIWSSQLQYLNLSSNNISGKVPNLSSNFAYGSMIDLSSNLFYGLIPNVPSTLSWLNLSRNKFSGGITFLCHIVNGLLYLDLSHNFLSGQIPDCLWHFKELKVLNLEHNNLFGRLPPSIGSLVELEVLYLYNNNFSGELPSSIKNCTSLKSLNLGANKFLGNVPVWIGENLSGLYVLVLRSNNFFGTIPLQLCQLPNLHILDLSINNLHGTIPLCLSNLTSMVHHATLEWQGDVQYDTYEVETYGNHVLIGWQGYEREFSSTLRLLKSIDLSSNNLTGQIPNEIADLHDLIALNLSKNALFGEIPWKIGEMKKLLTLDLSRNNLSGRIPSSMSEMTLLNDLDLSFNNLSGRIPSSTQLQSFQPSRYDGNTELCGLPLTKKCLGDEKSEVVGKSEDGEEGIYELKRWFYIGVSTGFATGFWIACGALIVNRRGRHAFFRFLDWFKDWVYVKVVVLIANSRD